MPGANVATMPSATPDVSSPASKKASAAPADRKYKCQFCHRAFSRSEHRSRHERSHTKERPFKCTKCKSTFVRRDLLLRHDRTVHAKDGGVPLHSDGKRRGGPKARAVGGPAKPHLDLDASALQQIEASSEGAFDVETAAMLVADLHHKATAAARGNGSLYDSAPGSSFSQNGANMMDTTVTYPNGAIGLAPAQWDTFMHDAKGPSSSSSDSGSFEAQKHAQLAPIKGEDVNGLVPALQSMINSLPPSVSGTPTPMSPSLPHLTATPGEGSQLASGIKLPQVLGDEERNMILDNIRNADIERTWSGQEGAFRLPNLASLNRFLATYFTLFHHHLPFLHPGSFEPTQVSPALLLAVLSVGALYSFDQEHAYALHIGAKVLVNQFLQNKESYSSRKCPLWIMQSSLLNMVFASWSGDAKGLEWACSIKSLLANMVSGSSYELKIRTEARGARLPTRAEWIEDEGCRRTYYAVYIFFGLLTMSFNHPPVISISDFANMVLPSTETLWNANVADEAAWQEQFVGAQKLTFTEAHDSLFQGDTLGFSVFGTRVMINALFLEVWYYRASPCLQDVVTEWKLRLALETWEKSLDLSDPEQALVPLSAPHKGHPLIFNAKAVCRNARARLVVDLKSVQECLRYHNSYEVASSMSQVRDRVERSDRMIKVIQECFECLETIIHQGVRWVRRTLPTNWSIEHPLCSMDLMIILSMWLFRLEHDEEAASEEELVMYNKVRMLLSRDLPEPLLEDLGSCVARIYSDLFEEHDVVVWGITRLMGESFRLHSLALRGYADDAAASSSVSTPSMTSQGADEDSVY